MVFNRLLLGLTNFQSPLLRAIVPCAAAAFGCQAIAAIPSIVFQTERFFDFSGSITFLTVGALSLYLPALRSRALAAANGVASENLPRLPGLRAMLSSGFAKGTEQAVGARDWRQLALAGLVVIWATRLGSYLFSRVIDHGKDSRFDKLRTKPLRFSIAFIIQAVWVTLPLMPVLALNAVPASTIMSTMGRLSATDVLGLSLWVTGFAFEAISDAQKSRWLKEKRNKTHDEEFLTSGLFSVCRYPNYFGEITMWTGIATTAASILARHPVQLALGFSGGAAGVLGTTMLSFLSPAFTALLLLKVSGIPLSEPKYDKKFGNRKDYQQWRNNTPQLIPKLW